MDMDGNAETGPKSPNEAEMSVDQPSPTPPATQQKRNKDWLAVGGIGIEKRRRSSNASYRIENNKVLIDTPDGVQEFEIVESKEKHGNLRKAVPTLPVPLAAICCILSFVPGLGTLVAGMAVLCGGYPTEHRTRTAGFCWNLLAAVLMAVSAVIVVGFIWSVQRGVIMIQESMKGSMKKEEEKEEETV